jgi:hypothetical protein
VAISHIQTTNRQYAPPPQERATPIFRLSHYAPPKPICTASYSRRQEWVSISNAERTSKTTASLSLCLTTHHEDARGSRSYVARGNFGAKWGVSCDIRVLAVYPSVPESVWTRQKRKARMPWFSILQSFFWLQTKRKSRKTNIGPRPYTPDSFKPNEVFRHHTPRNANL